PSGAAPRSGAATRWKASPRFGAGTHCGEIKASPKPCRSGFTANRSPAGILDETAPARERRRRATLVASMPRPLKINRHGAHDIEIVWDDGRTIVYPSRLLRERCPCAMCRDEWTGERLLQPNLLPILVFPAKLEPVG